MKAKDKERSPLQGFSGRASESVAGVTAVLLLLAALGAMAAFTRIFRSARREVPVNQFRGLLERIETSMDSVSRQLEQKTVLTALDQEPTWAPLPESMEPGAATDLRLNGIAWNPDHPLAFIDGNVLSIGKEIGTLKVVSIERNSVTLRDSNGREQTLRLYEN